MDFASIFRVNGEPVTARIDGLRKTTSVNGALRSRLLVEEGHTVVVSVPVGLLTHTCTVVVAADEHDEEIVLGQAWFRQFSIEALQIMQRPEASAGASGVGFQYTSRGVLPRLVTAQSSNHHGASCVDPERDDDLNVDHRPHPIATGVDQASEDAVCVGHRDHTPCLVAGGASQGAEQFDNHNELISEVSSCFGFSRTDIIRCDYSCLIHRLEDHGLSIGSWSLADARHVLTYHMLLGMCAFRRGKRCGQIASSCGKHVTSANILLQVIRLAQQSSITSSDLRHLCGAIGFLRPKVNSCAELAGELHAAVVRSRVASSGFDLVAFFSRSDKASKFDLFLWCSEHALYPVGLARAAKELLITHVVRGECFSGERSRNNVACQDVVLQHPKTFPDADRTAFILSVACLSSGCSREAINTIHRLSTGVDLKGLPRAFVQNELRQHIYTLRRGRAVYHDTFRASHTNHRFLFLNRIRAMWPSIAPDDLLDETKALFEKAILAQGTARDTCASCSIKYAPCGFTDVSSTDVDLSPLGAPDDWGHDELVFESGPLSNLVIDDKGILSQSDQEARLRLCFGCARDIKAMRVPKFALANYLFCGTIPDVLSKLSPVEESMIALCRARCIMVQLKTMRGNQISQRAYRGHAIFHQQDTTKVETLLPPSIEDILTPICVLFIGSTRPSFKWIREHAKPLVVRADRVRRALQWLKINNPLYASITINHEVLNAIEKEGGLPYHVEYADDGKVAAAPTSTHDPNLRSSVVLGCDEEATPGDIPFENLVVSDLDNTSTPQDLRAAALRHLMSGKGFFMYGHSAVPESEYHNSTLFPSLYPTLFPYGTGGFDDIRRHPRISMATHARHLLNIADSRFREHPSFIFSVFNILQRREVCRQTTMRVSRDSFATKAHTYANLDPCTVQRVSEQMEKGQYTFDDPEERQVMELMRDVHSVNSNVMGSCAARLKMRNEIRGMIVSFGVPSFFITVNPADVYNPLVRLLAGEDIDIDALLPEQVSNYHKQSLLIARDSVLAARFFDIYLNAFFSTILRFNKKGLPDFEPGILGVAKGYYGTVEAQGRGSLHCHMLIWLEGGLSPSGIRDRLLCDPGGAFERRLISYLEMNIRTAVSQDPGNVSDVPSSQHHPCSVRPIQKKEKESEGSYAERRHKDLFNLAKQCQMHVHNAGCYKNWKGPPAEKLCRFRLDESKRNDHTKIDRSTGEILGQCLDGMVNPFNGPMLEILRCNMDLKFIGSGCSAHAVLYYITDYISKTQLKTHVAYNVLELAIRRLNQYDGVDREDPNYRAKRVLLKCANAVISKQELSAQQIASYLLGNGDFYSSHQFREVYWKSYVSYISHFYPDTDETDEERPPLPGDISDPLMGGSSFITAITDEHGNLVPKANRVADYIFRPAILEEMCLWDFLCQTNKVRRRQKTTLSQLGPESDSDEDDPPSDSEPGDPPSPSTPGPAGPFEISQSAARRECLDFGSSHPDAQTHILSVLDAHARYVLVPLGPPLPRRDRPAMADSHSRLMLIFFKPWRQAPDLKGADETWSSAFQIFLNSDLVLYEHVEIMDNIQFLHDCRDSRDHTSHSRLLSQGSLPSASHDDGASALETELSCDVDDNDLIQHQQKHDRLLHDINKRSQADAPKILDCLSALFLAGFSSAAFSSGAGHLPHPDPPKDPSINWSVLRSEWKAVYASRRKMSKTKFNDRPVDSPTTTDSVSRTSNLRFDDMDFTISSDPVDDNPGGVHMLPSDRSDATHRLLCEKICNEWTLNPEQKRAFLIVANHAYMHSGLATAGPLTMLLASAARSRKTWVLNALRQFFCSRRETRQLRVSSFMGIAANNIEGSTLHSALNLMQHSHNNSALADDLMFMWDGVHYLFIDEVSMIGCEFLQTINTTLSKATGLSEPFGCINVIFAGDMAQLPPVGETSLSAYLNPSRGSSNSRTQKTVKGRLLWLSVTTVVVLKQIQRQSGEDNARFVELLTRLRHGECTMADYRLLETRVISPTCNISQWPLDGTERTPVIVCENAAKDAINLSMSHAFAARSDVALHDYVAIDTIDKSPVTDPSILQITDRLHSGHTSGRLKRLPLAIGMPVMVTTNLDVPGGIVNGSIGTVRSIDFTSLANGDRVLNHCIVHIPTARSDPMPHLNPFEFPIMPSAVPVRFSSKHGKSSQTLSFSRFQVPLIPAFAMTAHKSQGQTIDKAIVDLAACHGTEAPYVMVSRVRRLDDLLILRPFPFAKIRCRMSEDSRRELARIQHHHLTTILEFGTAEEREQATIDLRLLENKRPHDNPHLDVLDAPVPGPSHSAPRKRLRVS